MWKRGDEVTEERKEKGINGEREGIKGGMKRRRGKWGVEEKG